MELSYQQEIDIGTVDDFINQYISQEERRIFLKIDTQGYDLKVFEGVKRSLDKIFGLLSELSLISLYEGMPHYLE